jgi:hypothetical protein
MSTQGFTVWAVMDIRRAGRELPVYLEDVPLDGTDSEIPVLGTGVIASWVVPDSCCATQTVDYFYRQTKTK